MRRWLGSTALVAAVLLGGISQARAALKYHGGRIMASVRIIPIYYGNWAALGGDENTHQNYLVDLAHYINGDKNPAGKQSLLAEYGVTAAPPPDMIRSVSDSNPRALTATDIENVIHNFQSSTGIAYAPDRLFILLPASGYSAIVTGGCAYHANEGDGKYWAVVPRDCGPFLAVTSHEVIEAATDPGNDGWDEAVDPCSTGVDFGAGPIALPFDNLVGGCTSNAFDNQGTDVLQVLATISTGGLYHTLRHADGSWAGYGNVKTAANSNPGSFTDVDAQTTQGVFNQVVGRTSDGKLWHTIRTQDGAWMPFDNVSAAIGANSVSLTRIGVANVSDELQICARTSIGGVRHSIRHQNNTWVAVGDVMAAVHSTVSMVDVDCTGIDGELHVAFAGAAGGLFHAVRHADGSWTGLGDVKAATGSQIGSVIKVTVANVAGELQLTALASNGQEFHGIRHADGSWTGLGVPPNNVTVTDGTNAGVLGELHLVSIQNGGLRHRIRHADGSWTGVGNVDQAAGNSPGAFTAVGNTGSLAF